MYNLIGRNSAELWFEAIDLVLDIGKSIGNTKRLSQPIGFSIFKPRERLISFSHGGSNPIYPYIEAMWILAGYEEPDMVMHYNRFPMQFVNEHTRVLDGAYGPRLVGDDKKDTVDEMKYPNQLMTCAERLRENSDSRRAVCTISNPAVDWDNASLDIPCTMTYQFLVRDGKLDMITNMRSNDLIKGFPNDTMEFQWIQEIMAGLVGCDLGTYYHIVGSLHIYDSDINIAKEIMKYDQNRPNLYKTVKPLDARLDVPTYNKAFKVLLRFERKYREKTDEQVNDKYRELILGQASNAYGEFYSRLLRCIMAYNLNKAGYLEEAYNLISDGKTDIEYILKNRWKDVIE